MSSAFKNFFITFAICLLIFAFVGFVYVYPWLRDVLDFGDMGETSETVSGEVSGETSDETSTPVTIVPDDQLDPNGDVFTAFVMCVDSEGQMLNGVFIDSNAKSKQFVYCPIAPSVKSTNEIGTIIPIGDLFKMMRPEAISQTVSALTGIETKYCLKFDREGVKALAMSIPGAYIVLNETISLINPIYADYIPIPGQPYPDDYYITISNNADGKVILGEIINERATIDWLLEYNPNVNGAEYNAIYVQISKAMLRQFLEQEDAMKNTESLASLLRNCETNLTLDAASGHIETIFSYNDFNRHEMAYPANWQVAVVKLRELDGSYK